MILIVIFPQHMDRRRPIGRPRADAEQTTMNRPKMTTTALLITSSMLGCAGDMATYCGIVDVRNHRGIRERIDWQHRQQRSVSPSP